MSNGLLIYKSCECIPLALYQLIYMKSPPTALHFQRTPDIAAARDMCRTQITRSLLQPTCRTPLSLVIAIEQQAINASN